MTSPFRGGSPWKVQEYRYGAGTHTISQPIVLESGTHLKLDPSALLYRADGVNAPLIKNKYCGYINKESRFTRASNVATVLDFGHTFVVGDQVYVRNLTDTGFNGLQTVTSVVAGVSWTYANTGSDYSSGSATKYGYIIPVRRTLALASFTADTDFPTQAATGFTYVADATPDVRVGFIVFVGSVGPVEVVRVDATGWTYSGAVPTDSTVALSYDYDITIEGGTFDGNRTGQSLVNGGKETSTFIFGAVNNLSILGVRHGGSPVRAAEFQACQQVTLRDCEVFDTLVGVQFEGGARRVRIENMRGSSAFRTTTKQQTDDFIAFTGTVFDAGSSYNNVMSPYGVLTFDDIRIRDIHANGCLNGVKISADDLYTFDNMSVDGLTGGVADPAGLYVGGSAISIIDDGTGLTGTTVGRLTVRNAEWQTPAANSGTLVRFNSTGSVRELDIDSVDCNSLGVNGGIWLTSSGTITRLRFSGFNFGSPTTPTAGANVVTMSSTGTIKELTLENFEATFGTSASSNALIVSATGNTITRCTVRNGQLHPNAAGRGVVGVFTGRIDNFILDNVHATDSGAGLSSITQCVKTGGGLTTNIYVNNCNILAASPFSDNAVDIGSTTINHYISNSRISLSGGNNIFQYGSAGATVVNVFSSGVTYSNTAKLFLKSVGAVTYSFTEGGVTMFEKALTTAQVKALFGTPITVAAAPGANKAYVVEKFEAYLDYATAAYAGIAAGEDLAIRYTDAAGTILSAIEATGFLDQTSDQTRVAGPQSAVATETEILTPTANAALVVHMTAGDVITGDSPVYVRVWARIIDTVLT